MEVVFEFGGVDLCADIEWDGGDLQDMEINSLTPVSLSADLWALLEDVVKRGADLARVRGGAAVGLDDILCERIGAAYDAQLKEAK